MTEIPIDYRRFVKYGRIAALTGPEDIAPFLDRELEVSEKIDGGNCQVRKLAEWELVAGSKANFLRGSRVDAWPWFRKLVSWVNSNFSLYDLPLDVIVFGEWGGHHTIQYAPENVDRFFEIDILDLKRGRFMEFQEGQSFLKEQGITGIRYPRVLAQGKLSVDEIHKLLNEPSDYYNGPKEGLVIKDYTSDPQAFFKIYTPEFSPKEKKEKGKIDLLTVPRFRNNLYELLEASGAPHVSLKNLARKVIKDIQEEEGQTYSCNYVSRRLKRVINGGKLKDVNKYLV